MAALGSPSHTDLLAGLGVSVALLPDTAALVQISDSGRTWQTAGVLTGWTLAGLFIGARKSVEPNAQKGPPGHVVWSAPFIPLHCLNHPAQGQWHLHRC